MKYKHISCLLLLLATLCTTSCVEEVDFGDLLGLGSSKLIVPEKVDFDGNDTEAKFSITASGDWSISGKPDWFNLSDTNGSGNAEITITTTENPSASQPRSATLTVTSGNRSSEVVVTQSAAQAKLSITIPGSESNSNQFKEIEKNGQSLSFTIETNSETAWEISIDQDGNWLNLSNNTSNTGKGPAVVSVDVAENTVEEPRTAIISVKASGLDVPPPVFEIKQTGIVRKLPNFKDSKVSVSPAKGTTEIQLVSGGDDNAVWFVSVSSNESSSDWLRICEGYDKGSYPGKSVIKVEWDETTSKEQRTATLTLSNYTETKNTCTITQAPGSEPVVSVDGVEPHKNSAEITCTVTSELTIIKYGIMYREKDSKEEGTPVQIDKKDANGQYTYSITGLKDMTTYQVKAYAVNGVGRSETYWVDFTTKGGKPEADDNNPPILQTKRRKSKK